MPLVCLEEVRDPRIFDEVIYMASQYGSDVGEKYVRNLIGNAHRTSSAGMPIFGRKPRGYWFSYVLDR